jgi:1,4-alpha-glucan branching enzyme
MVTKGRKKGTVRFVLVPSNGASRVEVAGDFNAWQPEAMRKQKNGAFVRIVPIEAPSAEYKFVVDGEWRTDPDNPEWALSDLGTINSVAHVR